MFLIVHTKMYVKLRDQVALRGQKSMEKHNLQIQGRMQFFEKMALNRGLTLPDCRSRCQLSESGLRSQKGPLGVELWSFYCRKRILVPMSYISFWDIQKCIQPRIFRAARAAAPRRLGRRRRGISRNFYVGEPSNVSSKKDPHYT